MKRKVSLIGCDAGGTMTDIFAVDDQGDFIVGKAASTPGREAVGFWASLMDAAGEWGLDWNSEAKAILPAVQATIYSGTGMLNALLTRTGDKIGVIITRGQEHALLHERAAQVHAGYSYEDKTHKVTHIHNEPFVPLEFVKGVTERVSVLGEAVIPLYEHEVRDAVAELIDKGVAGIVILFLCSYVNPVHEQRAGEIAKEVMKEKGQEVRLYLSYEVAPIMREVSRLNCMVLQAYGAEPARQNLLGIDKKLRENGYRYPLQVVLADGGIANVKYPALYRACFSGPVGGILGAKYLSKTMSMPNLICTDLGGTSFDVGLIMGGEAIMLREVETGRSLLNVPTLYMDSLGAGCGQYLSVAPESKRLDIGPGSAGAEPGPVSYNMGNKVPTVMDCCLILGLLNPDNYLGGKLKLRTDLALEAIKTKCSDVMGVDAYNFAEGVTELINIRMREHIKSTVTVRGYALQDYHLLSYGGAGPMFLDGYSRGLPFKGVFTVPWAAAFSAYGCTAGEYLHRYQKSCMVILAQDAEPEVSLAMGSVLNSIWKELEKVAEKEMAEEGYSISNIEFKQVAYIRYGGQLDDLEIISPVRRINSALDMNRLIDAFESKYSIVFAHGAKHREAGYQIFEAGLIATVEKPMPRIVPYERKDKTPPQHAAKGVRKVYHRGKWHDASIWNMDSLVPGNEIEGLAIIEAPATTLVIYRGRKARMGRYKQIWLEEV